jgi:hypothetical protein
VHTAHFYLNGVYGNWVELGIALRYDSSGNTYYRVFKEWGINFSTLGAVGYDTPPCTRITIPSNTQYGKFRIYFSTNWRFELDCEDGVGFRSLGNAGIPGGFTTGKAGLEWARNWTASESTGVQNSLQYRTQFSTWVSWPGSQCMHDAVAGLRGTAPTATSWNTTTGSQSC